MNDKSTNWLTFVDLQPTGLTGLDFITVDSCHGDLLDAINTVFVMLRYRLFNAGFLDNKYLIVADSDTARCLDQCKFDNTSVITDDYARGYIYVLTVESNGKKLIHPPFLHENEIMSWNEYLYRFSLGENLKLIVLAPWAQARINLSPQSLAEAI